MTIYLKTAWKGTLSRAEKHRIPLKLPRFLLLQDNVTVIDLGLINSRAVNAENKSDNIKNKLSSYLVIVFWKAGLAMISHTSISVGAGKLKQWIASLSVKPAVQVRDWHDPLVSERWNSVRCYLLVPTSVGDWFNKGRPCVIMSM